MSRTAGKKTWAKWAIGAALALTACGFTQGGTGSGELEVIASGLYDANSDVSHLRVQVHNLAQEPIGDASVTFTDAESSEAFTLEFRAERGDYTSDADGYRRRLQLKVEHGEDWVDGAIAGPGPHVITKPPNARSRKIDRDLWVQWSTEDGVRADQVLIELTQSDFVTVLTDDPGGYHLPQIFLRPGTGQVSVQRQNAVVLGGGAGASSLRLGFHVANDVTVEAP